MLFPLKSGSIEIGLYRFRHVEVVAGDMSSRLRVISSSIFCLGRQLSSRHGRLLHHFVQKGIISWAASDNIGQARFVSTSRVVMSDDGVQKARLETEAASDLSEQHYHLIADDTFDALMDDFLGEVEDNDDLDDVDINYSQGVMAIKLGPPHGTWVINKQTPNRQIWWSSPISGPMRYELPDDIDVQEAIDEEDPVVLVSRWKNTKDGSDLLYRLRDELKSVINIDILEDHK